MASPGELIDTIALVTGVPRARVFSAHRYLREANLISQGGRGSSAAKMTCRDAAHLLLATAAVGEVKDSPAIIERPGALVTSQGRWHIEFISIPELEMLPEAHTFADGIEALIGASVSGSLQLAAEKLEGGAVDLIGDLAPALNIEVTILGPLPRGTILIQEMIVDDQGDRRPYQFNSDHRFYSDRPTKAGAGNLARFDLANPRELDSDLQTRMTISHKTIASVGRLLADKFRSDTSVGPGASLPPR